MNEKEEEEEEEEEAVEAEARGTPRCWRSAEAGRG